MKNPKTLNEKIASDTINTTADFILGYIVLLIITIPMFMIKHHII